MVLGPVDYFCSRLSIDAGERMFGTASRVDVWLLLEYRGRWHRDLLAESALPTEVKQALVAALRAVPRSRLVFIKRELRVGTGRACFVAVSRERQWALHRLELTDYRDLLAIDLPALVERAAPDRAEQLYLVCADGKHDRCCAKFGLPVYRELARRAGEAVWQSSHVGGDRFAANVVCLPSGAYYGHVAPEEAGRIVEETAAGRVYLDKFRGRCCYGFDVQAAEYFARVASGLVRVDAFALEDVSRTDDGLIRVRLAETSGERIHRLELVREPAAIRNYLGCGADRPRDVPQYALRSYRVDSRS